MKNYVITGSLGHISKPVATGLVKAGKNVTIITSSNDKVKDIEAIGAKALVGSVSDKAFVTNAFKGTDVVYTMIPPIWQTNDWRKSQDEVAAAYIEAIKANNVKYVVNLSSVGAHLESGVGPVTAMHYFENDLNNIAGLNVKHLRPGFFYYNFLAQIPMIKQAGIMGANYGGDGQKIPLVHTSDIAKAALEELLSLNFKGNSVRSIVSDIRSTEEIVSVLGKAIDKQIPWVVFTDEQQQQGMLQAGLPETIASGYTEMGSSVRSGKMLELVLDKATTGSVKLEDYAKEFTVAYKG